MIALGVSKPINVKGINFSGLLAAYERAYGAERRTALERQVAEPVRAALASREILAAGWYPAAWYDALLRAVEAEEGEGAIKALAGDAVTHDFQTLFRVVRLFLKPQLALRQSVRISSRYFDGGQLEVVSVDDGSIHYRLRGYHGFTRRIWLDFMGGVEGVLGSLGGNDVQSRVLAGGVGSDLELIVTWRG